MKLGPGVSPPIMPAQWMHGRPNSHSDRGFSGGREKRGSDKQASTGSDRLAPTGSDKQAPTGSDRFRQQREANEAHT